MSSFTLTSQTFPEALSGISTPTAEVSDRYPSISKPLEQPRQRSQRHSQSLAPYGLPVDCGAVLRAGALEP